MISPSLPLPSYFIIALALVGSGNCGAGIPYRRYLGW